MRFEYRRYKRRFRQPLRTAHGVWTTREGLLLRVEDASGTIGFGECAPLESFGTESLDQAMELLNTFEGNVPQPEALDTLEKKYPCLRSAFDMAFADMEADTQPAPPLPVTALLPDGFLAIEAIEKLLAVGYRHFKWKVGREPVKENAVLLQLLRILPKDADLRVDANAAFDRDITRHWLRYMEGRRIAWFEQPMAADKVTEMSLLSKEFLTPIALDESVARVEDLERICKNRWRGKLIVKPSIMGSRKRFLEIRKRYAPDLVYSTAFETSIGLQYLIDLAASDPQTPPQALGLGGENFFIEDPLCIHEFGAQMAVWGYGVQDFEPLWEHLKTS